MLFPLNATGQSVDVRIVDDSGLPVTGLVAATFPPVKYSRAGANADVTISLSNLATLTSAWASGGVKERGEGAYRLDVPDAIFTSYGKVQLRGEATNKRLLAHPIDVNQQVDATYTKTQRIGSTDDPLTFEAPTVDGDGIIRGLIVGGSYKAADGRAVSIGFPLALGDLTGATAAVMKVQKRNALGQLSGSVDSEAYVISGAGTDDQTISFDFDDTDTASFTAELCDVEVIATLASGEPAPRKLQADVQRRVS